MSKRNTDILVAGGGIAGRIAALCFAQSGQRVICVDPNAANTSTDLRSTAFLNPACELLASLDLLADLAPIAADLRIMRLCDMGGKEPAIRKTVDFDASSTGAERFGLNVPNADLMATLAAKIEQSDDLEMRQASVETVTPRLNDTIARLSNGQHIRAKLIIAADGRDSKLREGAQIDVTRTRFGQKAIVFQVSHPIPHDGISTELHRSGGPFTLVPLADPNHSAIVWMDHGPQTDQHMQLDDAAFAKAATARSAAVQGDLTLVSKRAVWPIIAQQAKRLTAPRMALVAEAAHVVPPIGAQGLNMSLRDITILRDLIANGSDPGAPALLAQYQRKRMPDLTARHLGVNLLNRAAMTDSPMLRDLRERALSVLGSTAPLKNAAIRAGLGV